MRHHRCWIYSILSCFLLSGAIAAQGTGTPAGRFFGRWELHSGGVAGRADEHKTFYQGTLHVAVAKGGPRVTLNLGRNETMTDVVIEPETIRFSRPLTGVTQYYQGRLASPDRIEGVFDHQGAKQRWWAIRVSDSPAGEERGDEGWEVHPRGPAGSEPEAAFTGAWTLETGGAVGRSDEYKAYYHGTLTFSRANGQLKAVFHLERPETVTNLKISDSEIAFDRPLAGLTQFYRGKRVSASRIEGTFDHRGVSHRWWAFRPGQPAPEPPPAGQVLKTQVVAPSAAAQPVTSPDGVRVTIPGGLLKGSQEVRIARPAGTLPAPPENEEILAAWDVSIGDLATLPQAVTLELPYDPAALPSGIPPEALLSVVYWNKEFGYWGHLPAMVDARRKLVVAQAWHLSPKAITKPKNAGQLQKRTPSGEFNFETETWRDSDLAGTTAEFYLNGESNMLRDRLFRLTWCKSDLPQSYGIKAAHPEVGRNGFRWREVPDAAEDVWVFLHRARNAYAEAAGRSGARLRLPKVNPFVHLSGSANSASTSNLLFFNYAITLAYKANYRQLRHDAAHEYFHAIQHQYFNAARYKLAKWWLESTADYAAEWVVWGGRNGQMGGEHINPRYLEVPLTYATWVTTELVRGNVEYRDHEYTTSFFLEYLVREFGVDFLDLWQAVSTGGSDLRASLDGYLQSHHQTRLGEAYLKYARHWAFDPDSPARARGEATIFSIANNRLNHTLAATETEHTFDVALDGEHTAKVFLVSLPAGSYQLSVPALPADVAVDLWARTGNDSFRFDQALGPSKKSAAINGREIAVLVVNNGTEGRTVQVKVRADVPEEAPPAEKPKPVDAAKYQVYFENLSPENVYAVPSHQKKSSVHNFPSGVSRWLSGKPPLGATEVLIRVFNAEQWEMRAEFTIPVTGKYRACYDHNGNVTVTQHGP